MSVVTRFLIGAVAGAAGLAGLAYAASEPPGTGQWIGLAVFAAGVLAVMGMIRLGWRHGPSAPGHEADPWARRRRAAQVRPAAPLRAPAQPLALGQPLRHEPSPVWGPALPWLRGGACTAVALVALVVAASASGAVSVIALAVAIVAVLVVFRLIAHGGRPPRLIPLVAPEGPGATFALGGVIGLVGLIALASTAHRSVTAQTIGVLIAIAAVLAIFVLIGQGWDRAEERRRLRRGHGIRSAG